MLLLILGACDPSVSRTIGLGATGAGDVEVTGELDFGDLLLGETAERTVTITNVGDGPLAVQNVLLDAEGVTMAAPTLGGMASGESAAIRLTYTPMEAGCVSGNLRVLSDDADEPVVSVPVLGCAEAEVVDPDEPRVVDLVLNVDDGWTAYLDGTEFTADGADDWTVAERVTWEMEPGEHLLAIHAQNAGGGGGLIGAVYVDGAAVTVSGDDAWLSMAREPGDTWPTDAYDDSRWLPATRCAQAGWGAEQSGGADEDGAAWVNASSECRGAPDSWYRVRFTVE